MISIIIPVYNGENMIKRCYESIIDQTYKDYEIIFINDGSIDNSLKILRDIATKDSRVNVLTQENRGVVFARELGIKSAKYNYIIFLDIDDTLPIGTLDFYSDKIKELQADIYVGELTVIKGSKISIRSNSHNGILKPIEYIQTLLTTGGWELCGKMYNKSLFSSELLYPPFKIGEDAAILFQLTIRAQRIVLLNRSVYNYIINPFSASHIQSEEYAIEGLKAAMFIEEYLSNLDTKRQFRNEINTMFLLFYSNSLKRGYIKDSKIIANVKSRINFVSLKQIGAKKGLLVLICIYGGIFFYNKISKFFR